MVNKLGRNYKITIEGNDGTTLPFAPPFTLEFDIVRNNLTSSNVAKFRLYNLNQKHRDNIRLNLSDTQFFRSVKLLAGYGNNLSTVFSGSYNVAWSTREGTNFITQLECYDSGYAINNSMLDSDNSNRFPAGTTYYEIISQLAANLAEFDIEIGYISPSYTSDVINTDKSFAGNTWDRLKEIAGNGIYIDSGKFFALKNKETIGVPPKLISAQTGLLGTPIWERAVITFNMIFEPSIYIGMPVYLQSSTVTGYNNIYKVAGIKHHGMISPAVCGTAETEVQLFTYGQVAGL